MIEKKGNQPIIKELLQLLEKEKAQDIRIEDIEKIRAILENNKKLINYQHCKDNKLRSLLHIVKYNSKLPYEFKQKIVNTIVDVGYKLFNFSADNCVTENCHALFFVAAKGDYAKLKEIVEYFKGIDDVGKLHCTKEGDTLLSFMVKFGDYTQENYLKCFKLLVDEKIDFQRIDYYKNSIKDVIEKEKKFLIKIGNRNEYYQNLTKIEEIITENSDAVDSVEKCNSVFLTIMNKNQLFNSIINNGSNFKALLKHNLDLVDSDDGENTLLQLAIIKNNLEITKELLQNGANPNHKVEGRNEEVPLILAAKLNRDKIFQELLENQHLKTTNDMFVKFVSEIKPKFLNYLLESSTLNVDFQFRNKTPLYYAIIRKNRKAVQSLLQRGARLTKNCLSNINPKDLEEYFNSCIKFDSFKDDMEENDYKAFLVFDFFIKCNDKSSESKLTTTESEVEGEVTEKLIADDKFESEIEAIRKIGSNKRLKYLLEHPLIYIFILLKWYRVRYYYFAFVFLKIIFYSIIVCLVTTGSHNHYILSSVLLIQFSLTYLNFLEFKWELRRYTLHFILEILIFMLLVIICILKIFNANTDDINQVSAFIIILISLSMLLTLGYHVNLSKWMSMAKRVFKNFIILLLFFLFPILAFAMAFKLLLPFQNQEVIPPKENEDFKNIPRAIFRTFVMLAGDIGDKKFSFLGGYIMFILFAIGMTIILMNFWTGVAVSDIKEIEEQSTVVACNNVIVFIESVERMYLFLVCNFFQKIVPSHWKHLIHARLPLPFLKYKVKLKKKKKSKFHYGIDLFINAEKQFKSKRCFKSLKLENDVISKIKSLYDEKELSVGKTLKHLMDQAKTIEEIHDRINKLDSYFKRIEELLESKNK
ncbi:hypothetical protein NQ314_000773 [Rhamnusium bicolor]|uniref:Ion transport domain-containing protein n=1 Tax=Rhamnusium bicolor TaxID=1586634 RepID=A0AAV8ZVG8_9CUCU|nr:hypothetical protein NQ314_000773 [Rhamnusium bicolor]